MAEQAHTRMTVEEFLDWDDGTDTRHMLVDGAIVAMAPPSSFHSRDREQRRFRDPAAPPSHPAASWSRPASSSRATPACRRMSP